MPQKPAAYKVQGMHRDSSPTNFNPEKAFEIVNMRLITDEEGSAFSLVNEKGTTYKGDLGLQNNNYKPLGQCATTDSLIVFTKSNTGDSIFRIKVGDKDTITVHNLYTGNLGFQSDKPIETLFNYEAEDIQKVYWIDGVNQLRCINIAEWDENGQSSITHTDTSFDSILALTNNNIQVSIERLSGGSFKSGVIQYYATYFNKYRTESTIIWQSPLLYLANSERGAEADSSVDTAFKFTFTGLDNKNWGFIRVYSVYRGSVDTEPSANIVQELSIKRVSNVEVFDYGTSNTAINASDLYFVGSKFVKAGTMTVKDQVLFLGNLSTRTPLTPPEGIDLSANLFVNDCKEVDFRVSETEGTYYKYDNQLDNTAPISTYKNGETYRFGYQLQDEFGAWGDPMWIKDATIDFAPKMDYTNNQEKLKLAQPYLVLPESAINTFKQSKAIAIRPLVVYPDVKDRSILCQGVVCPTVYNLKDRVDNSPYAQASWFMRPNIPGDIWGSSKALPTTGHYIDKYTIDYSGLVALDDLQTGDSDVLETLAQTEGITDVTDEEYIKWSRMSILLDEVPFNSYGTDNFARLTSVGGRFGKDITEKGSWVEFRHNYALKSKGHSYGLDVSSASAFYGINKTLDDVDRANVIDLTDLDDTSNVDWENTAPTGQTPEWHGIRIEKYYGLARGAEIDSTRGAATMPVNRFRQSRGTETLDYIYDGTFIPIDKYNTGSSAYYVDSNVVTLNSPEIELTEDLYNKSLEGYKFRIVGMIPLTANIADISLETSSPSLYSHPIKPNKELSLNKLNIHTENIGFTGYRSLVAASPYLAWFHLKYNTSGDNTPNSWGNTIAGHLLYPWHSTGNIQTFMSSDSRKTSYSKLKRKVLSNARFSAITYYLPKDKWWNTTCHNEKIITWTSTDNSIQKFFPDKTLDVPDIVYKGNVDSLAMQDVNGTSYDLYYYSGAIQFKGNDKKSDINIDDSIFYSPTFTMNSEEVQKGMSIASSIKYKSSPHFAIFLGGYKNEDKNKTIVEILPTLDTTAIKYHYNFIVDPDNVSFFTQNSDLHIDKNQVAINTSKTWVRIEEGQTVILELEAMDDIYPITLSCRFNEALSNKIKTCINRPVSSWPIKVDLTKEEYSSSICSTRRLSEDGSELLEEFEFKSVLVSKSGTNLELVFQEYNDQYWIYTVDIPASVNKIEAQEYSVGLNQIGYFKDVLEASSDLTLGFVYENPKVASLPIQQIIHVPDNSNYNLPDKYWPRPYGSLANPINYGWLWLGEIYKETSPTFGGTSEYALLNNKWEVAGESVSLSSSSPTLKWSIGDTYYQRFDTLKTYAYSDTDENSVIDITSFMVETHLNIDGRYDRNRGQESNLNMSPKNFNLFNKVYTQRDNFFTYSKVDKDAGKRTTFPNQITWSLAKTAGEPLDQWMNITLTSILDLDGRKGNLSALKTYQNEVIAFQDKGISNVIYNPRTQITSTDGTPIYIANSAKVEGTRYITESVGCQDKWSIVTSSNGLYFIDFYNKSIYKFNGQIEDVANAQGFHTWCIQNLDKNSQVLGYYDQKNKDVYFINANWKYPCLAFNEFTNSFSSFYSYKDARLSYIQDKGLWVTNNGKIYTHQTGEYNKFFDNPYDDYHVTVVCNQDGNLSKIFNTVEFRSDSWTANGTSIHDKTVDYLGIETGCQEYTAEDLEFDKYRPSNLKKKFNVWRANIPREKGTMNRFRDVWAKVTLGGKGNSRKTRLNDIVIYYT